MTNTETTEPQPEAKELTMVEIFNSPDGRFSILRASKDADYVKLVEYVGHGPRLIVSQFDMPYSQLKTFVESFSAVSADTIE
jgi:hypothetical protein